MRFLNSLLVLLTVFLFNCFNAAAQTRTIEGLKLHVLSAQNGQEKLATIFSLCNEGYTLHPDTLMRYATAAKGIASQQNNLHDVVQAMYYQSFALTNKGLIDSSLNTANHCLDILAAKKINDPVLLANVLNQKGRCYMRKNQYKEAINMGYQVIDEAEKGRDAILQMKGKTLIGWAYLEMGQTKEALNWHLKALRTTQDTLLLEKYGILFANIALNYNGLGKTDSALYFIDKAILYSRRNENLFALSNSLAIQAQLFVTAGYGKQAEAPLKEVIAIRKLIGDPFYIVSDMAQLALYYAHNGQSEKGIALCNEGIDIAEKYKMDTKLFFLYSTLAENYKAKGSMPKYAEVLERIISLKDSVYQKNSEQALAEMQTKYDLQKKENLIIRQQINLARQDYIFYGLLLFLLFALVAGWLLFKGYRKRNQLKMQLMMQEEKRQTFVAISQAEENERRRIAADLHDNMGAYASAISANVDDMLMGDFANSSVLHSMKNNAAEIMLNLRDTIWVLNKDEIFITGISDRFKNYVQKINAAYPAITVEIKERINNNISLSPQNALNMIRIMQEAFHNAIKHSKCSDIIIEILCDKNLVIRIIDNGIGFSETQVNNIGNGLRNMNLRAKANGWKLIIKSHQPSGTLVELNA